MAMAALPACVMPWPVAECLQVYMNTAYGAAGCQSHINTQHTNKPKERATVTEAHTPKHVPAIIHLDITHHEIHHSKSCLPGRPLNHHLCRDQPRYPNPIELRRPDLLNLERRMDLRRGPLQHKSVQRRRHSPLQYPDLPQQRLHISRAELRYSLANIDGSFNSDCVAFTDNVKQFNCALSDGGGGI
jgi:hypothetical protein